MQNEILLYKIILNDMLVSISLSESIVNYNDVFCKKHKAAILYNFDSIVGILKIATDISIPTSDTKRKKRIKFLARIDL